MPSLGAAFQPQPGMVREQPEAYQSVLIWQPTVVRTTGARAALTKAPILRDVPQVRRKLTSRNSTSGPRFDPTLSTASTTSERGIVSTIIRPTQNWLREKPSRAKLTPTVSNVHASGLWKRGTLHFRDNGNLLIYSDEHSLLHSIACEDLCTTHIRKVDSSLFGKTLAMGIFARPSTLAPISPRARLNSTVSDEPIYLCFYTRAALYKWLYLLRICAQPEVYGSPLSISKGGTHRFYRQIDLTINGVRFLSNTSADPNALMEAYMSPSGSGAALNSRPTTSAAGQDRDFDGAREDTIMQCYCVVRSGPYAIAKTKVHSTTSTTLWLEKFSVGDLAPWTTLTVELMQSQRGGKSSLFGVVDLPVQTMRRGEDIDGWFPIWSTGRAGGGRDQGPVGGSAADPASAYSRELIGELKLAFHLRDEVIMPRKRYENVSQILNSDKFIPLVTVLTKVVDEQSVLGHLVDVFASSGTIVPRMADLTQAETDAMHEGSELELLFRGNSLLSRSLDKYQRTYCTDWLFDSVGLFILNICSQRIVIETPFVFDDASGGASNSNSGAGGGAGGEGGDIRYLDQAETMQHLKEWTRTLWLSIYGARTKCPPDLQRIFANIRTKVDAKFAKHEGSVDPGKQAVGAFAFLRLICPAIATPHLYGILPSAPEPRTSKILTTLAKIILSLANRRSGFEKDTWLAPMTDFLKTQANLYDDYINTISTPPAEARPTRYVPFGDEDDTTFARAIQEKIAHLYPIHSESIPSVNFAMDEPLALATFTSYIARNVPAELIDDDVQMVSGVGDGAVQLDLEALGSQGDLLRRFTRHACIVEEHAGYYVEKAGYDAVPLEFADRSIKHHNMTTSLATVSVGKTSTPTSVASPRQIAKTSPGRRRGATVSASGSGHREVQRKPPSISVDENGRRVGDPSSSATGAAHIMSAGNTQYDSDEELRAAYRVMKGHAVTADDPGRSDRGNRPHSSEGIRLTSLNVGGRQVFGGEGSGNEDGNSLSRVPTANGTINPDASVTSLPRYGLDQRRNKKWWKLNK
ncbi:hypothetical protein CF327_g5866 [Tilletia walkeri]|uniref:Ras-GAP domain-containing protein n=1 Tax=Tilletia walkeri TaxID=117179 RepID=A0A8X7N6C6_9BASI|nr:hypothetical protein CF327_g5866 [Tilletia walkeri]KAE8267439.1 hypothetical protein A4X09_0g4908 [Tilletia walkeri]